MRSLACIALLVALAVPALACRCGETPTVPDAVRSADAIFVGRVVKLTLSYRKIAGMAGAYEVIECEFDVSEPLKGPGSGSKSTLILTSSTGTACGYSFVIGQEYLVYARKEDGELRTSVCTRTRPRIIIDEKQDFRDISKVKADDAMQTEVPLIREALKRK